MRRHIPIRLYFPRDLDLIQMYLLDAAKFKEDMAGAIKAYLHRQDFKIYPPANFKAYQVTKKSHQIHLLFDTEDEEDFMVLEFLSSIMKNRINDTLKILYRESLAYAFIDPFISWNLDTAEAPPKPKQKRKPKEKPPKVPKPVLNPKAENLSPETTKPDFEALSGLGKADTDTLQPVKQTEEDLESFMDMFDHL